ncbi:hypothetical protein Memar_0561 [Methanoculleus marisnigri JR1]|uniref:Uncharacterized protein n=1 Tax=Methanoculleus marisnigri (strain ATCC 35101 / DSM 1498 / JR1) TaxID=368407 RepID=A3CSZ4_METMJ|nr:hypothetical protein Memar_0561 [Methanoculleus marisnigri JR1]
MVFRDYLDIGASHKVRRVKRLEHEHRYVRVTTVRSAMVRNAMVRNAMVRNAMVRNAMVRNAMVRNAMVRKNRSVSAVRCEEPERERRQVRRTGA